MGPGGRLLLSLPRPPPGHKQQASHGWLRFPVIIIIIIIVINIFIVVVVIGNSTCHYRKFRKASIWN